MNWFTCTHTQIAVALLVTGLLVSGCSGSGDSQSPTEAETEPVNVPADDGSADGTAGETESPPVVPDPVVPNSTRVNFNITVPVYVSNALQVRLAWGDIDIVALWNSDELWTASGDFQTDTEHLLTVTFYDRNGEITLGSFEKTFKTGSTASESYQITADQFDTDRWDSDNDGLSNINELIAGTNPLGDDTIEPVQASLELMAAKTFRLSWQPSGGSRFYRVLENPDGVSGFTQISGDLDSTTEKFDHRVALYARVNARYIVQACNAGGCVDSDELIVVGTLERAIGYIKASNPDNADSFGGESPGNAVSLSADGNTLAVGAPGESSDAVGIDGNQSDNSAGGAGAVYVFVRIDGNWHQQAYLKASNTDSNDKFGIAVSLSADGNTLAAGADNEDSAATGIDGNQDDIPYISNPPPKGLHSGAVYVFVRSNGRWQQQSYVKASNADSNDNFGGAISLSSDGNSMAVGAIGNSSLASGIIPDPDEDDGSAFGSGAAYVFVRVNGSWQQQAYVKASNPNRNDWFGKALSLSANGNTLAVGAYGESSVIPGIDGNQYDDSAKSSGAVYVFTHGSAGWQQQAYIKASNPGSGDEFGQSVSLSADGDILAVGASGEDSAATGINGNQRDNSARLSGAVYVFARSNGNWQQQTYMKASNPEEVDRFGNALGLSADGDTLAVTSLWEDSRSTGVNGDQTDNSADTAGAAYVFVRSDGNWQQQAYVKASNTDSDDRFGGSLSLSADGATLAISSLWESSAATGINGNQDDNSGHRNGAVYLY